MYKYICILTYERQHVALPTGCPNSKKIKTTNKNKEYTSPIRKHHTPPAPLKASKQKLTGRPLALLFTASAVRSVIMRMPRLRPS
jgi:hypothetical protein